jgi:hypothetical protein
MFVLMTDQQIAEDTQPRAICRVCFGRVTEREIETRTRQGSCQATILRSYTRLTVSV